MSEMLPGFEGIEEIEPAVPLKGRERNEALIAAGVHPATRRQLADNGCTCGDCAHLWRKRADGFTGWKCRAVDNAYHDGPDMTKRWPACTAFTEREVVS